MSDISPKMDKYYKTLNEGLYTAIGVAKKAREKGLDPSMDVEIPVANDLADRVEAQVGISGVAARIRELEAQMSREEASLKIGDDFAAKMFGETTNEEILDHAIRTAMALLTEGVVSAPIEGIAKVTVEKNDDGTDYLRIYYAGPIRSAGGTAQALSVLVGDYVRRTLGLNRYIPRKEEVERYIEEIRQYNSIMSLQYLPSEREIRLIINNCPVCIDGEPTEREEVSGYRNLERVETNTVRGGMALVIAEGLALKAPKVLKNVNKMKMDGWDWLDEIIHATSGGDEEEEEIGIKPKDKYLRDLIGGRPVFSYPMREGGFRLRYGRSRNTGLAAGGLNPATLHILGDFLAVGTQMKTERPGKAAGISPVDTIEGPTVRLINGDVVRVHTAEKAKELQNSVSHIIDVGEILISYGEFMENNHVLVPSVYCEEWWLMEGGKRHPKSEEEAIEFADNGAFLHPEYTLLWDDLSFENIQKLADYVSENGKIEEEVLLLPEDWSIKELLEKLLLEHEVRHGMYRIRQHKVFIRCLGLDNSLKKIENWDKNTEYTSPLMMVAALSGFRLRSKAGTRIGGRMGRPGKSKPREMKPAPNMLFPVGDAGGSRRSVQEASKTAYKANTDGGIIELEMGIRRCEKCGNKTYKNRCECGGHTEPVLSCPNCENEINQENCPKCGMNAVCAHTYTVNIKSEYTKALENVGVREREIQLLKGVKGVISKNKTVECLEKGILRAMNKLWVFKDGTVRFDMIDMPLTHFRPKEVRVSPKKLIEIGYTHDIYGEELRDENQVLELPPQDILVADGCAEYLMRTADFIDQMLEKIYDLPPFYNIKSREELVGHLVIGLAPHTSAGVLARIVGFSKANVGYGHPFFHAAKRRNCDGDEDCVMLLLDGLINFSRSFLPETRGGSMDAPLVLSSRIDPSEIDKESHNVDVCDHYPLELYLKALEYVHPKEVEKLIDRVELRLGTPGQIEGFFFTNDTTDISAGPLDTMYTQLKSMVDKLECELELAKRIRAVDADDVAERVLQTHFIRDLQGNLNAFSKQKFRCTRCNTSFRRMPISGKCTNCGNNIIATVHEGSVKKYLQMSRNICEDYKISEYTKQRVEVIDMNIESTFGEEKVTQLGLADFM